ncbi:hypothetical protein OB13_08635 [Pontibacter sp. HJ8]
MLEYSWFERLPLRSQTETLARDGIVLAQRRVNNWTVTLYDLNNTYVEVWAGQEAQVISTFRKAVSAMAVLEPYMENMEAVDWISEDE